MPTQNKINEEFLELLPSIAQILRDYEIFSENGSLDKLVGFDYKNKKIKSPVKTNVSKILRDIGHGGAFWKKHKSTENPSKLIHELREVFEADPRLEYLANRNYSSKHAESLKKIPEFLSRATTGEESLPKGRYREVFDPKSGTVRKEALAPNFREMFQPLKNSVLKNYSEPGLSTLLAPLNAAISKMETQRTPTNAHQQEVINALSMIPPRVLRKLESDMSEEDVKALRETADYYSDLYKKNQSRDFLNAQVQPIGDTSLPDLPPAPPPVDMDAIRQSLVPKAASSEAGTTSVYDTIADTRKRLKEIKERQEAVRKNYKGDNKEDILENLRLAQEGYEGVLRDAANPRKAVTFDPSVVPQAAGNPQMLSGQMDDDARSISSAAPSEGNYNLRSAIADDVEERDQALRDMEDVAATRGYQGFDMGQLPQSVPGEHYTTTLQRWLDENIARHAATHFNLPNTIVPDSRMLLESENRIMDLMERSGKLSDAEKLLVRHFRDIAKAKDDRTEADDMIDAATRGIDTDEVESLMNPHIERMMDRLAARSNRSFNESRDRRIREHERDLLRRYHGSNWNSGSKERFNKEFYEDERLRERDHIEALQDQEAKMLFQGNIEGWARARGMRDALERGARHKEDTLRHKQHRTQEALERGVMLDQSKQQAKLSAAGAAHQAGIDRMGRDQNRQNQAYNVARDEAYNPFQRMFAAKSALDGSYVTPPQSYQSKPVHPSDRSLATNIGAAIQGAAGAYGAQREAQARSDYYNAESALAQKKLQQMGR